MWAVAKVCAVLALALWVLSRSTPSRGHKLVDFLGGHVLSIGGRMLTLLSASYRVLESQLHTKFLQQFSLSPLRNFQTHVIFRYLLKKGRLIAANRNTCRINAMPAARRLGLHVGVV